MYFILHFVAVFQTIINSCNLKIELRPETVNPFKIKVFILLDCNRQNCKNEQTRQTDFLNKLLRHIFTFYLSSCFKPVR